MHVIREVNTFLFLRLLHSSSGNIYSVLLRSRVAPGCPAAIRTRTVREVLYAASDVFVMAVVVPLLVAMDDIHHRAGDPRDQFHWHADDPRKLPEPQISSSACLALLFFVLLHQCVQSLRPVSAVQPRIKLSGRLAVVLLVYSVECLRYYGLWCVLSCLLFSRLHIVNASSLRLYQ